jgi:phosphoribosylamine---glycine ligase
MKILLLGSGGREHALAWKLKQSTLCSALFIAPGNAGTNQFGTNLNFSVNDFDAIRQCCIDKKIDLVFVGPEEPLVNGIVDFLNEAAKEGLFGKNWIRPVGPVKKSAQLEGSKAFAKDFMLRHAIPTAAYREFNEANFEEGVVYLNNHALPIVIKADGLAAGKGVIICNNTMEAVAEFDLMLHRSKFGEAGKKVVIEQFLDGIELSVFVLTDGKNYVVLPEAKDYKRIGEGDTGPNTGGMGAVSPVPFADEGFMKKVKEKIIIPTINGLQKDELDYCGFIFIGLIKVGEEPYVIEYNCRMGDPETEVVLPRLKNDLVELFKAAAGSTLDTVKIEIDDRCTATIVAVSGGYPGEYEKGIAIAGLETVTGNESFLFHCGTKQQEDAIVTNGGRVFCITSYGDSVTTAADKSKAAIQKISFDGMYYRTDIGYEFM